MADEYIDYWEIGEYTDHFVARAEALVGASKLVDVALLRTEVRARAERVAAELKRAGITRSKKRGGSGDVEAATARGRKVIDRFWNHLGSLDDEEVRFDLAAFFPGEKLGALAALKPADVKAKLSSVLHGFAVPDNAKLSEHASWKKKITSALEDLVAALEGRLDAHGDVSQANTQLITARAEFLAYYNGVAKPLLRGLLNSVGRGAEYEQFFGDLLVNETGSRAPAQPAPPAPPADK